MLKITYLFLAAGLILAVNSPASAQGNAHTPEQIAEKLRQLEAMTAEKIKRDFKDKFDEDMEALDLDRIGRTEARADGALLGKCPTRPRRVV